MAGKIVCIATVTVLIATTILQIAPTVLSDETAPFPSDKAQLSKWFTDTVKPLADRKSSVDPALLAAESVAAKVIKVRKDGSGDFKTVTEAVNSIPAANTNRTIVWIGAGNYAEKIRIERTKPFVTFYGSPKDMPTLSFGGTAAQYGTVDSASLIVESDYFTAVNIVITNSAPRPDGIRRGAQAVAFRVAGDKAALFNCKIIGFQDTVCDYKGRHFFKDCYIEGTVDFIFGRGKSIYLNTELHVVPGDPMAMITAQARNSNAEDTGYSFVHCRVTGAGGNAFLGRAWMPYSRVVYAYTDMTNVVNPKGWSDNFNTRNDKTVFNGEYKCTGEGASSTGRVEFAKQLSDADAAPFLNLAFIEGSKWILPPPTL